MTNLESLSIAWQLYKGQRDEAREKRHDIENQILDIVNGETKFFDLRIAYKENRVWNNAGLAKWDHLPNFPFKSEYKEVRALSKQFEAECPALWKEALLPLLTIKPHKPYFSVKGKKND